jgi:hypothetical protein
MATATPIGVFTRVAGVWERVNAGTPEGFSGPQVRQGGSWSNALNVQGYASGWNYCWVNIDGEISFNTAQASDFDISPYTVQADLRFQTDGSIDRLHNDTVTTEYSQWRFYDCGREYEIYFDRTTPGTYVTAEPTLTTWLTFTDGGSQKVVSSGATGIGFFVGIERWDVKFRESVSAPAGGNDEGVATLTLSAEI